MVDSSGMALIRSIDISKAAKGFAEEQYIMKSLCTVSPTSAREIRWYSRTKGVLTGTTTTGITQNLIANVGERARPTVVERSWTRNTSYVRKYFVESPTISMEDIKDTDPDILATNIRDLTMAVTQQVDSRIYNVISGATGINAGGLHATWEVPASALPIQDIVSGASSIAIDFYDASSLDIVMSPRMQEWLIRYLIITAGSSIPNFSSDQMSKSSVMNILGHRVRVTTVANNDTLLFVSPQKTCTWKEFMPITATTIDDPGIGTKIRCWTEGEAISTDPESSCFMSA